MGTVTDFTAGLTDLIGSAGDLVGLASATIKYPFNWLAGEENPFQTGLEHSVGHKFSNAVHDFGTDTLGANEESAARQAGTDVGGFALDLFSGKSGTALRTAAKAARAGRYARASKLAGKALLGTAATNTAINAGMSALTGTPLTPTESVIAGFGAVGALPMIKRGGRYFRSKAKLLEDQFQPNIAQKVSNLKTHQNLFDARGDAVKLANMEGFNVADEHLLSPKDLAKADPLMFEAREKLKVIDSDEVLLNQYNQLSSELQQRLQAPITLATDGIPDQATVEKFSEALGVEPFQVPARLARMRSDELIPLMKKDPSLFPETGYIDKVTGQPISNIQLLQKIDSIKSQIKAENLQKNREFYSLFQKNLDANRQAGLISEKSYLNMTRKGKNIGYIPKSSLDAVPEKSDILGVYGTSTSLRAATQSGMGVGRQANSFKTAYGALQSDAAARAFNGKVKTLAYELKEKVPKLAVETDKLVAEWERKAKSLTGWDKHLAELNVAYYKDKAKELSKYVFLNKEDLKHIKDPGFLNGRDLVSYMQDGKPILFTIPKGYMKGLFGYGDSTSNPIIKGLQRSNGFATQFKTGKWNALNFGFTKAAYALWEGMPALKTELAKRGINYPSYKIIWEQAKQAKNLLSNGYYEWLIANVERRGSYLGYTTADVANLKSKLTDSLFSLYTSPIDNFAELKRSGAAGLFDVVNPDTATTFEYLASKTKKAWDWVDQSAPVEMLNILNQASAESMSAAITKIAKDVFPDDKLARQQLLIDTSKKTSDTRRRGLAATTSGKVVNTLSDVMPYGKSTVQGLVGKLEYLQPGDTYDMMKNLIMGSRGMDKLINLGIVLAGKTQGEVFDMLWKYVVAPTAICYFWNNMTPDQAEDYHELTNLARSKNRLLINFGGRGTHAYFPVDQEWSVLSNLTEAFLDDIFGLSDQDPNNPDWEYKNQVLKSAGRALGVEFPVAMNAVTGLVGFTPKVNAETLLGGEDPIFEKVRDRVSYELGEVLGIVGNTVSMMSSPRPFNTDMLGQIPLITNSWSQAHNNSTSAYVDKIYRQDPQNFPCKDLMTKRKYMESRLRHFRATGLTMDGRPYNMPRQQVIETINHNIQKLNGEMYRKLKEGN